MCIFIGVSMDYKSESAIPFMEAWKAARAEREQTHPNDPDSGTFRWPGNEFITYSTKSPTAHLTDYVLTPVKQYWLREEIPVAEELMSYAPDLVKEFLEYHTTFTDSSVPADLTKLRNYNDTPSANPNLVAKEDVDNFLKTTKENSTKAPSDLVQSKPNTWLIDNLKYTSKYGTKFDDFDRVEIQSRYPTACKIVKQFGDNCPIATYSVLNSDSIIKRHTGIENRMGEYLRIHMPLIIPEGDIFFECEGYEIDWTDIWAFDNQLTHSAYNYTPHRRLIFLIDIKRSYLGLPNGTPYDGIRVTKVPKFVRGALPKVLHTHQRSV